MSEDKKQLTGLRFDSGKLRLDLIPAEIMIELGGIFTGGSAKYFDHNWRGGMEWGKMLACHDRHYLKWRMGTSTDPELNRNHLAIAAWNLLCLMVYEKQGLGYDNRALPEEVTINDDMEWVELSEEQKALNVAHNQRVREFSKEKHEKAKGELVERGFSVPATTQGETIEVGDEVIILEGDSHGMLLPDYAPGIIATVVDSNDCYGIQLKVPGCTYSQGTDTNTVRLYRKKGEDK